ncbi:DEAD/DEAH box helicase family protein [Mycobacterium xenopi 3993]|nr:DEAD/DEAH box helicase family protein [Mycobacterium xenopi 3993]
MLEVLRRELAATRPMNRLLQGEVGSGKTIVAVLAMLQMVDAGYQCALLAPTEVLAAQHVLSINEVLGPLAMGGQLGALRTRRGWRCSPARCLLRRRNRCEPKLPAGRRVSWSARTRFCKMPWSSTGWVW